MLSVLIPIYNFKVETLVRTLSSQLEATSIEFEIFCIDDGSDERYLLENEKVNSIYGVKYKKLKENIGRASIRRMLAEQAIYDHLLFLDCDVAVEKADFIAHYLENISNQVIIGGLEYQPFPPSNKDFLLRWKYGIEREQRSAQERLSGGFMHFLASNLLIHKELFLSIPDQADISGYGHEDTWLGLQLRERGVHVKHIDNPVIHLGLDSAQEFLTKSLSGVNNLVLLYLNSTQVRELRLISAFNNIKNWGLLPIAGYILKMRLASIESNLKGSNPNLKKFDQWKLYQFIKGYQKLSSTTRS